MKTQVKLKSRPIKEIFPGTKIRFIYEPGFSLFNCSCIAEVISRIPTNVYVKYWYYCNRCTPYKKQIGPCRWVPSQTKVLIR